MSSGNLFAARPAIWDVDASDILRPVKGGVEVDIMVTPNAKKDQVGEVDEWRKRLVDQGPGGAVRGPGQPRGGRAAVRAVRGEGRDRRGHTDRHKTVLVPIDLDTARARLEGQ